MVYYACYDDKMIWKTWKPLYVTGLFSLVQVSLGMIVSHRVWKSLSTARSRDAEIIEDLLLDQPKLEPAPRFHMRI